MDCSLSLAGVGSDDRAEGGGRGFFMGAGKRPLIEDMPRGGGYWDEATELLDV